MLKRFLSLLLLFLAPQLARADWTFSVTNAPVAIVSTQNGPFSVTVRENTASPTAAFTIYNQAGPPGPSDPGVVLPAGAAYQFTRSTPWLVGQTVGWIKAAASGPFTFAAITQNTSTGNQPPQIGVVPEGDCLGNTSGTWSGLSCGGGGGIAVGDTVTGATEGSLFYSGLAGILAQDNANLSYVAADKTLKVRAAGGETTPMLQIGDSANMDNFDLVELQSKNGGDVFGDALFINAASYPGHSPLVPIEANLTPSVDTGDNLNFEIPVIKSSFVVPTAGTGTILGVSGMLIQGSSTGTGLANAYGLHVLNITGATNNWAINTGLGKWTKLTTSAGGTPVFEVDDAGNTALNDLTINGTCTGCGSPGGSDTQVQFNDGGAFGGDAGFTYDKTTGNGALAGDFTIGKNLNMPNTNGSSVGVITFGSSAFLHNYKSGGGSLNIFLGNSAGNFSVSGDANTIVGTTAAGALTSGVGNTGIGFQALFALTSGSENVGVGDTSLPGTTTGSENVAVGDTAGAGNTTGSDNTFIGHAALASVGTLTNATAVGANAAVAASNTIQLGDTSVTKVNTSGVFQGLAIVGSGTAPSVGTCGTIGTGSKNTAGFITSDTTGSCVSVLTFSYTAPTGWSCGISNSTTANLIRQTGSSTTTATFTGVTVTSDTLRYICNAY